VSDSLTRTTLRLPAELHQRLKMIAASQRTTSEAILEEALRRELDRRGGPARCITIPDTMDAVLAELFLESMPTFALIKDRHARIVWVNGFAERALKRSLPEILRCTITELGFTNGLQRETIEENINRVLDTGEPLPSKEGMNLSGLGKVTIRAHRFMVNDILGDISFIEDEIRDEPYPAATDVIARLQCTTPDARIERLLLPFLERAPVAIAIKRPLEKDSEIVWGNKTYLELIGREEFDVFGRTTTDALQLPHTHPIIKHETEVATTGRARMAKEQFHHRERWSLRFPIFDDKNAVRFVGVVSPDFKHHDAHTLANE
jgi:PAS domain-containing protein